MNIMKAFIIDRYSKKIPMRFGEMPAPELRDDDVLIEVHAAGLNPLDSKIKSGEFKLILPYRMPLVPGHDVVAHWAKRGRPRTTDEPLVPSPLQLELDTTVRS